MIIEQLIKLIRITILFMIFSLTLSVPSWAQAGRVDGNQPPQQGQEDQEPEGQEDQGQPAKEYPNPESSYHHDGLAIGIGTHKATENEADEDWAAGVKYRWHHYEAGYDYLTSEGVGGAYDITLSFGWIAYIEEFGRPRYSTYGLYAGLGYGIFFTDEPGYLGAEHGPFFVGGWDMGEELTLEGKLGPFGDNYWGTAMTYWNF